MSTAIKSNGVALPAIFDPYVAGTTKAPASGIDDAGNDTSNLYAKLSYGSAAAPTGISGPLGDLNVYYAAKGTASYGLPIDGNKYSAGSTTTSSSITVSLQFQIATSGWSVVQNVKGVSTTLDSGSIPSGAVSCQYVDTWTHGSGDTGVGNVVNQMTSYTTITGANQLVSVALSVAGGGGSKQTTHTEQILMKNSAGAVISTTTITFLIAVDGE